MINRRVLSLTAAAVLTASCASIDQGGGGTGPTLLNTEWRLIHFRSSDDAIGMISARGAEDMFTLQLQPDGAAAMRFTCNRGTGQWTSPDARSGRGSLTIAGSAMTMAACPPSRLDRFATDLPNVRSFVIRDGRLNLNLAMDAGNYVFVPNR